MRPYLQLRLPGPTSVVLALVCMACSRYPNANDVTDDIRKIRADKSYPDRVAEMTRLLKRTRSPDEWSEVQTLARVLHELGDVSVNNDGGEFVEALRRVKFEGLYAEMACGELEFVLNSNNQARRMCREEEVYRGVVAACEGLAFVDGGIAQFLR